MSLDYNQSTSAWGKCMQNAITKPYNWREKRNNRRPSGFGRASRHQTLASTPVPFARYLSRLHAPACWDLFDVITRQIPLMQSCFNEPWLISSTQHHPLLPWQPSASPLLGKPKGFIRDQSSKLLSPDPHRDSRWHAQSCGCAWETKSEIRPSGDQTSFCARLCARKCTCRWSRVIHSELWMTPTVWKYTSHLATEPLVALHAHTGFYWDSRFTIPNFLTSKLNEGMNNYSKQIIKKKREGMERNGKTRTEMKRKEMKKEEGTEEERTKRNKKEGGEENKGGKICI